MSGRPPGDMAHPPPPPPPPLAGGAEDAEPTPKLDRCIVWNVNVPPFPFVPAV